MAIALAIDARARMPGTQGLARGRRARPPTRLSARLLLTLVEFHVDEALQAVPFREARHETFAVFVSAARDIGRGLQCTECHSVGWS